MVNDCLQGVPVNAICGRVCEHWIAFHIDFIVYYLASNQTKANTNWTNDDSLIINSID